MKKMTVLIFALLAFRFFIISAGASNIDEYRDSQLSASGADKLEDLLDDDTREILNNLGIDGFDIEKMLGISPQSAVKALFGALGDGWKEPVKGMFTAVGAAMVIGICTGFVSDDEKSRTLISEVGACFAVLTVFAPAYGCINACIACIKLCAGFEKALIPVLAALLTVSGKPASALSIEGAAFAAAELVSALAEKTVLPAAGLAGALNICSGIMPEIHLKPISETLRKTVNRLMYISAALFTGFVSLKNVLASTADGMGVKAVKLVTATFVPVVGGALSEAYSAFAGSLGVVKNTVGVFGIAALAAIGIPVLAKTAIWVFSMRISASVSELFGSESCAAVYSGAADIFSTVNTVLLLTVTVFVISAGTVVVTGAGG